MLHLHTSNRLEKLIKALAEIVKIPRSHPLAPEFIVVQSKGLERWLVMELAIQLGIWTNGYFPFPEATLRRLFKEVLGYYWSTIFDEKGLTWGILEILPTFLANHPVSELHDYLQEDTVGIKRYQLATQLAASFDQYLVYRPSWIEAWEAAQHPPAEWQANLWRALVQRYGTQHRVKLRNEFFQKLPSAHLPKRLSVFGISALPPFYLEVLAKVSQVTEVHIFLLNPCQEYWGDIVSDADIARKTNRAKEKPATPEEQYLEKGNSLLASMGQLGRDFMDLLLDYPYVSHEYFEEPGELTLLRSLQADILHLCERTVPSLLEPADRSVQIHVCHSAMREVEVLHDQLLALLEENPGLLPKDIVVMMPEVESYAPFIEAVFTTIPQEDQQIPFYIADRSLRGKSLLINTLFAILELPQSRFSANEVLAILEVPAVQKRFGLVEVDLDLMRPWITQTGIRWGMDAVSRNQMGLPAFEENTWRAGLNRLLLGYALPTWARPEEERLFNGILPFGNLEGREALILGKLVAFVESLHETVQQLAIPRSLPQWVDFLNKLLENFFLPEEEHEAELQQVRKLLNELVEQGQKVGFSQTISSQVVIIHLQRYLQETPQPIPFLTGRVTFGAMVPMRSIPFKVVCLLGMNDQAYPRASKTIAFDLLKQHPQKGDRSRRQNDRYLFLEALLSARDYFYISYVGQSIQDNTPIPPSVLVSELLDYIQAGFGQSVVTRHPLQPFSPRYFNHSDQRLFSFSSEYGAASMESLKERRNRPAFLEEDLPPAVLGPSVSLEKLTRFFMHPTQFLLKERLGLKLPTTPGWLEEKEPFEVQGLERYLLSQTLVEKSLHGTDLDKYLKIAKAMGQLPPGRLGEHVYQQLQQQIQPFLEKVRRATRQPPLAPYPVNLAIDGIHVTGYLNQLWPHRLVHYRCTTLKAKDHIKLWIHHIIINLLEDSNLPRQSLLIGQDATWEYQPLERAGELLTDLLKWYQEGLVRPLPLFPQSSWLFAQSLNQGKTEAEAFQQANQGWQPDEYYQWCFGSWRPLESERFKVLAKQFFEPLLATSHQSFF